MIIMRFMFYNDIRTRFWGFVMILSVRYNGVVRSYCVSLGLVELTRQHSN